MTLHSGIVSPLLFTKRETSGEGSLISGMNPVAFTTSDPLRLWTIQVGIIIVMAQLLSFGLRRLRQPKVVAEVLSGILLGPTALGRIPGFTEHVFPSESLPFLFLVADIGLCLSLFLVGLVIDTSIMKRNARMSIIVSLAGIALPFSLGSAISVPLYHHFIDPSVYFIDFMLFAGVAYSITAFPVLCPILTELKLLNTHLGIVVLSASVGNTIVAWILLALGVALVNASSGLTALWIMFVCIAFTIFLSIPVKFVLRWLAHKTGSIENGPSMFFMTVVMILVWVCSFFADSIGVNPIFGAFLAGLIVPREGGLAIALTEKLEDIVSIVFLPLYYTFSGLNTNLGLLDSVVTWAFTIAIIALSFVGKFGGCTIASKLAGYGWRESSMIGGLMSCKGLLELIVLNVGLQAGVLSQRVFAMFVVEALVLTLITTPLATALYRPERRIRIGETAGEEHIRTNEQEPTLVEEQPWRHRFTVVLDKLDHIPSAMAFTQLVLPPRSAPSDVMLTTTMTDTSSRPKMPHVSVEALQLIELSDRKSAIMRSSAADNLIPTDPTLGIFKMFGELNDLAVTTSTSVVPYDDFARSVVEHAHRHASHLILLPWAPPSVAAAVDTIPELSVTTPKTARGEHNPYDVLFGSVPVAKLDKFPSAIHSQFVRGVFAQSKTDVALFIDTGDRSGVRLGGSVHIFLPFFGGPDDRLALEFVVQLCLNPRTTATVIRMVIQEGTVDEGIRLGEEPLPRPPMAHLENRLDNPRSGLRLRTEGLQPFGFQDTIYGQPTTPMRLQSETADDIVWSKYASPPSPFDTRSDTKSVTASTRGFRQALARIHFSVVHTSAPVHAAIGHVRALQETSPRLLVVTGRSRRLAKGNHHAEMKRVLEASRPGVGPVAFEGMRKTMGDICTVMSVAMGVSVSAMVVLQAAHALPD